MVVKNACVLCNGLDHTIIENCDREYKVLRCMNCGLVYVNPIPPKELLENTYSKEYYTPWLGNQRRKRIKMWELRFKTLNSFSVRKSNLLDVGCGEGLFLEIAKENGWDVTGTEISGFAAKYGRDNLGLNIFEGEVMDAGFPDKTFDAITMWHVLEHTRNPMTILKEIKRIIKDNGVFILAVPNLDNKIMQIVYRIVKGKHLHLFNIDDREMHFYHFNKKTITMAMEKSGFKVMGIKADRGIIEVKRKFLNIIAELIDSILGTTTVVALEVHAKPSKFENL